MSVSGKSVPLGCGMLYTRGVRLKGNKLEELLEACQGFLDALHGFHNIFIAGSVAHAETFRRTECVTAYGSHVANFEQVHGKVGRVVDDTVTILLAKVAGALREEIEGALWLVHLKARNLFGELHDEVLAALKGLTHVFYALLVASECCLSCFLRYRART